MESGDILAPVAAAGEVYKAAKIEHYLRIAEECYQMARFGAAMKSLERALRLDPTNSQGVALKSQLESKSTLFLRRNDRHREPVGNSDPRSHRRSEVVLLVDQDEKVLSRLASTLQRYGLMVVSATSRTEALELLSNVVPDLVISEVNFEDGPSGLDLFFTLRSSPQTRRIPFMFLAMRIDRDMLIAGKRFGVDDFLRKPADEEVVAASVINCLARIRRMLPD